MLEIIQKYLVNTLVKYLPEPHGSLLTGILLGLQDSLPNEFYQALINTGTIHVVAASGFNTTIVSKVLLDVCSHFLPKKIALVVACLGILVYVWISGSSPSVVRAAIMSFFAYLGLFFGREYLASWSLFLTVGLMLCIDINLLNSVSFWLSVSATGGILWLTSGIQAGVSSFERVLVKKGFQLEKPSKTKESSLTPKILFNWLLKALRSDLEATMAAQIATLPIIIVVFGRVSLISPLANVAILWLIPIIMLLGAFKLFSGGLSSMFGYLWAILVFLPLEAFVRVIYYINTLPYINYTIQIDSESTKSIVLFCSYLIYFVVYIKWKYRSRSGASV